MRQVELAGTQQAPAFPLFFFNYGHRTWFGGLMIPSREYLMIFRWPGFLAVVLFGSSPTPSPPSVSKLSLFLIFIVCRRSSLLTGEAGRGRVWARNQIIRPGESLALYKSFNTLLSHPSPPTYIYTDITTGYITLHIPPPPPPPSKQSCKLSYCQPTYMQYSDYTNANIYFWMFIIY